MRVSSLLMLCLLPALTVFGQSTVTNPRIVEFDPSADHSASTTDGQQMVTRYDLKIFLQGAIQPVTTASLGKPAPAVDGKIRIDFSTILVGWPLANGNYEARVEAIGPTGTGLSDPSNPFAFQSAIVPPACTYVLSPTAQTATSAGGANSVTVTASATTCGWTASSNAAWATVAPPSGTGTGSVAVTVTANTGASRTATVTVGGQAYTVTQAAAPAPCTFALSASTGTAGASGGTLGVTTTASATTCGWTASSNAAWATVAPASGTGTGSVAVTVTANTGASRTATVTVGGQAYTVTQAAPPRPAQPTGVQVVVK